LCEFVSAGRRNVGGPRKIRTDHSPSKHAEIQNEFYPVADDNSRFSSSLSIPEPSPITYDPLIPF
jgi:hypothetical protein